jgi:predicted small secreted protein
MGAEFSYGLSPTGEALYKSNKYALVVNKYGTFVNYDALLLDENTFNINGFVDGSFVPVNPLNLENQDYLGMVYGTEFYNSNAIDIINKYNAFGISYTYNGDYFEYINSRSFTTGDNQIPFDSMRPFIDDSSETKYDCLWSGTTNEDITIELNYVIEDNTKNTMKVRVEIRKEIIVEPITNIKFFFALNPKFDSANSANTKTILSQYDSEVNKKPQY